MNNIKHLMIGLLLLLPVTVSAKNDPAFTPVQDLFAAISAFDRSAMKAEVTEDFQLLEHGEIWDLERLADAIMPKGKPYQRRNYFQVIRSEKQANSVWISYWNKASFMVGEKLNEVVWLESAVVVKQGDGWKIQLLHSTRLEKERWPEDVEWSEYVK